MLISSPLAKIGQTYFTIGMKFEKITLKKIIYFCLIYPDVWQTKFSFFYKKKRPKIIIFESYFKTKLLNLLYF